MIGIADREYRTHEQPIYVNGVAIDQVWVNGRMVYPEARAIDLIKITGHVDVSTDHTHYTPGYDSVFPHWIGSPRSFYGEDYDNPVSVSFHMRASFVCVIRDRHSLKTLSTGSPYEAKTRDVSKYIHAYDGEVLDPELHTTNLAYRASNLIFGSNHYGVFDTKVIKQFAWQLTEYQQMDCDLLLKYEMDAIPLCKRVNTALSGDPSEMVCYKMLQDSITWPCTRNGEVIHLTGKLAGPLTDSDDNAGYIYPSGESSGDRKLRVTVAGAINRYKPLDTDQYESRVSDTFSGLNLELIDSLPYKMWYVNRYSPRDAKNRPILTEPTDQALTEQEMVIDNRIGFSALPPVPVTKIDYIGHEADAPEWAKNVYETDLYDFGGDDNG